MKVKMEMLRCEPLQN